MANSDPQTPEESGPSNTEKPKFQESEHLQDPAKTEQAFLEIVSELSDLSTDHANGETIRSDETKVDLTFPRAPWVEQHFLRPDSRSPRDEAEQEIPKELQARGPRDWDDDLAEIAEMDRFVAPDPGFSIGKDPALNLGWFLTSFSLICALVTFMFTQAEHKLALGVLGLLFLCGVGLLIWRMPEHRHPHDLDGGAQV